VQGRDRRGLQPGGDLDGPLEEGGGDVVVEHHVLARDEHAADAAFEHLEGVLRLLVELHARAGEEHGLAGHDRLAEGLEPCLAQRGAGLDDVGDHVGDPEPDRGLDRAVEVHHLGADAALGEVVLDEVLVARGDAGALELLDRAAGPRRGGEAEGRAGEAERQDLRGRGPRVQEHVLPGDAHVDRAGADVHRDVPRAQMEQLHPVVLVDHDQLLGGAAAAVAGLLEQVGGGFGQGALVGHGDAEHGSSSAARRPDQGVVRTERGRRVRLRAGRTRPRG
jgi:hypothetical protein